MWRCIQNTYGRHTLQNCLTARRNFYNTAMMMSEKMLSYINRETELSVILKAMDVEADGQDLAMVTLNWFSDAFESHRFRWNWWRRQKILHLILSKVDCSRKSNEWEWITGVLVPGQTHWFLAAPLDRKGGLTVVQPVCKVQIVDGKVTPEDTIGVATWMVNNFLRLQTVNIGEVVEMRTSWRIRKNEEGRNKKSLQKC